MHPRISELLSHLDAERDALERVVTLIPEPARERRVVDGEWTVAELLDHLAMVEGGVAKLVAKRVARAREDGSVGAETETASVLGTLDRYRLHDASVPREAPEMVRPRPGVSAADAHAALRATRHALREAVVAGDGLALSRIAVPHPALGAEIDLYQWVLFVSQHERRHRAQLERMAERLGNGGDAAAAVADA